jgi:SP family arabinose:H+ symporter-like MFS transporter
VVFAAVILPAPESPRWLMKMARVPESVAVLSKINGSAIAVREAAEIQSSLALEEGHLSELFTSFRRPLLLGIMLAAFSQTSGITAVLSFLPSVFQAAGTATADAFLQSVLVGVVNLVFTLVGLWLIDLAGRKTLIVVGSLVQCISFAVVGYLFHSHGSGMLVVLFVMTFVIGHAFGNGVACWVIISEIYPAKVRGRAMSIATTALWIFSFLGNQLFPIMMKYLGPDGTFWSFSGAALVAMVCFWRFVPETRGRSLEEITRFWMEHQRS